MFLYSILKKGRGVCSWILAWKSHILFVSVLTPGLVQSPALWMRGERTSIASLQTKRRCASLFQTPESCQLAVHKEATRKHHLRWVQSGCSEFSSPPSIEWDQPCRKGKITPVTPPAFPAHRGGSFPVTGVCTSSDPNCISAGKRAKGGGKTWSEAERKKHPA